LDANVPSLLPACGNAVVAIPSILGVGVRLAIAGTVLVAAAWIFDSRGGGDVARALAAGSGARLVFAGEVTQVWEQEACSGAVQLVVLESLGQGGIIIGARAT